MVVKNLDPVCKIIPQPFVVALDQYFGFSKDPNRLLKDPFDKQMLELFQKITRDCGYERVGENWIQFPKQEEALERLTHAGIPDTYEVIEEHGDGDLTIKLAKQGKAIVTTDGDIYYYSQNVRV